MELFSLQKIFDCTLVSIRFKVTIVPAMDLSWRAFPAKENCHCPISPVPAGSWIAAVWQWEG